MIIRFQDSHNITSCQLACYSDENGYDRYTPNAFGVMVYFSMAMGYGNNLR